MFRSTAVRGTTPRSSVATSCVVALLVITCSGFQESPQAPSSWPPDIEGEWRQVETVEGSTGEVRGAASGPEAILRLAMTAGEETAGSYEYLEAGELVAEGRFEIAFEEAPGNDFLVWRPPFAGFHEQQWLTLADDTLQLRDATAGGMTVRWVRVE